MKSFSESLSFAAGTLAGYKDKQHYAIRLEAEFLKSRGYAAPLTRAPERKTCNTRGPKPVYFTS